MDNDAAPCTSSGKQLQSFETFCKDNGLPVETDWQIYFQKIRFDSDILVNEDVLNWLGYTGKFSHKNQRFKDLVNDSNQKNRDDRKVIPHETRNVSVNNKVATCIVLKPNNLIEALMKMKTEQARSIRTYLCKFMFLQISYLTSRLSTSNQQGNQALEGKMNSLEEKVIQHSISSEEKLTSLEKKIQCLVDSRETFASMDENQKSLLEEFRRLYGPVLDGLAAAREDKEAAEGELRERERRDAPDLVSRTKFVERQPRFCIIDHGDGTGYALRRQTGTYHSAKARRLARQNSRVLLEAAYSSNSVNLFNNVKSYVRENLSDRVSVVGNDIRITSAEYDMARFVRDVADNVPDLRRIRDRLHLAEAVASDERRTSSKPPEPKDS